MSLILKLFKFSDAILRSNIHSYYDFFCVVPIKIFSSDVSNSIGRSLNLNWGMGRAMNVMLINVLALLHLRT